MIEVFIIMVEKDLINAWRKAEKNAKTQEKFADILEEILKNQTTREEIVKLMKMVTDKKCDIGESFQNYFLSYALAAFRQSEYSYDNPNVSNLIPAAFLAHHCVELFIKFVKLDWYTWFGAKIKSVNAFLPANIYDLALDKHNVIAFLDDKDCIQWFSYIEDGERYREGIKRKYNLICKLLGENNIAVNMRYPMSKGYQVNDYSCLTEENVQVISAKIMDLIALCFLSNYEWAKNEDKQEKLRNDSLMDENS